MPRPALHLVAVAVLAAPAALHAAEPLHTPAAAPATPQVVSVDPHALALHEYFYVDFPRRLQALDDERRLAEAELALIARRVESYRPFRSFGRYAATYTADQSWQLAYLAARRRVECLRNDRADLWRERSHAALALTGAGP